MTFGARLDAVLTARGSLCVGIDPHAALLRAWGLSDDVAGLERFAFTCADALAEKVAVVKPQSAFFERFGSAGIAVLERTIARCREAGALVLLDVKRGDIGSTMAAYADAFLGARAVAPVDAITLSPYLGMGSLQPAFDAAHAAQAGVFVLALTSNPEGPAFQQAVTRTGPTVAQSVVDDLAARNRAATPIGSLGVVVGATVRPSEAGMLPIDLTHLNGPYLVPGIGAQGGTASDVARLFGRGLACVLPSVSREVLQAGPDGRAVAAAAHRLVEEFAFLRR